MGLEWFYIAVVLALSDMLHTFLWRSISDFYILFGELIHQTLHSNVRLGLTHELIEALFHFVILSLVFSSPFIGMVAATVHLIIDLSHEFLNLRLTPISHRALHFVIESIVFMIIFGI
ncbi:MAG: hypothetical protein Q4Q23_03260 [Methanobacteriaceae archaeon]|nr:hypothetical protein [Methanobacteriaceae archaeon]